MTATRAILAAALTAAVAVIAVGALAWYADRTTRPKRTHGATT